MTKIYAIALGFSACTKIGKPYGQAAPIDNQDQSEDREDAPEGPSE